MCGTFHVNGRSHSHTLRYRVTGFRNCQGIERYESSFRFLFLSRKGTRRRPPYAKISEYVKVFAALNRIHCESAPREVDAK